MRNYDVVQSLFDVKFVEIMIRSPFDFNTLSFCRPVLPGLRNNVLHQAVRYEKIEIVKILLTHAEEKNIDIDARTERGQSAIDIALGNAQLLTRSDVTIRSYSSS